MYRRERGPALISGESGIDMARRIYHANQKQPIVTRHDPIIPVMSRLKTMSEIESLESRTYVSDGARPVLLLAAR